MEPSRRAEAVKALQALGLSQREACASVHARRRSPREQLSTKARDDERWALRLTEVAQAHAEHGCRRLFADYERDADPSADEYMNYKRFRRIYRLANLQIGRRRRRGRAKIVRGRPLRRATRPFEGWTLDFVHDRLFGGRAFRTLSMEDEFTRTGLALEMSFSFPSRSVVAVLDDVAAIYGYPKYLRIDNGTELTSKLMQLWSEQHDVELLFIQPGKPTQNAFIESFNSRIRSELLNAHWFHTLAEAQANGYAWMNSYNTTHAHSALDYRTPEEFLATYETINSPQKSVAA
jgi:putative transposase